MTSKFCEIFREMMKFISFYEVLGGFFEMEKNVFFVKSCLVDVVRVLKVVILISFNFFELDLVLYVFLLNIYKMVMLTREDREFLLVFYKKMYLFELFDLVNFGEVIRKYNYVVLFGEVFGLKLDCWKLRFVNVMVNKLLDESGCFF